MKSGTAIRIIVWTPVAFIVLTFLLGMIGDLRLPILIIVLFSGWWSFLARTLPAITWNPNLIIMAALCLGIVALGTHWFLNLLARNILGTKSPDAPPWRWPWRWTVCGFGMTGLFFLVGMAVGGIIHQLGWISASPEPMFQPQGFIYQRIEMRNYAYEFEQLSVTNITPASIATNLADLDPRFRDHKQDFHLLYVHDADTSKLFKASPYDSPKSIKSTNTDFILFFPINPDTFEKIGGIISTVDANTWVHSRDILNFVATHSTNVLAL